MQSKIIKRVSFIIAFSLVLSSCPMAMASLAFAYEDRSIDLANDQNVYAASEEAKSQKITAFGFTQKTIYVKRGKTVKLPFIAYMKKDGVSVVSWSASNKGVVTVKKGKSRGEITITGNETAKLTIKAGRKPGKGKIALSANGKKVTIAVNVVAQSKAVEAKSIRIDGLPGLPKARDIHIGNTLELRPSFTKGATAIATWKSSKPAVIKINAAGKLKALSRGTATITLKVGGKTKNASIRVLGDDEDVDVTPSLPPHQIRYAHRLRPGS